MIRVASSGDVPAIKQLMLSVPGFWHDDWRPDVLAKALASAADLACVWEEERILGFICAHDLGFRGYLSELVVAPRAQKRGIGRQLVDHVQAELRSRGCSVLLSDVWKDARGFYESLRWSPPDVVLLRKRLTDEGRHV